MNLAGVDLDLYKGLETVREVRIYHSFLLQFEDYLRYYNETEEWTLATEDKRYTAWKRRKGDFIVRKTETQEYLDSDFLEKTMKDFDQGPKWNKMLSKNFGVIRSRNMIWWFERMVIYIKCNT